MFGEGIIVCFVMIFATTVAETEWCLYDLVDLPDVCFNPNLTTDCSVLVTSGAYMKMMNVGGVILNAFDSSGNLVDTTEYIVEDALDYSFTGSTVTRLEFKLIWKEGANGITYNVINQCFDRNSCSPVFNVLPCDDATRIEVDFELYIRDNLKFDEEEQENGLKGSSDYYAGSEWCFEYTQLFYLMEVSFEASCYVDDASLILEYYNISMAVNSFLDLSSSSYFGGMYTEVKEPMKKLCMHCGKRFINLEVEFFVAKIIPA